MSALANGEICRCCGEPSEAAHALDVASADTGEMFALERCAACGVLRTRPEPADLAPYYATDLASTMTEPGSRFFSAIRQWQLDRELRRFTGDGDAQTVIDVGCGVGDFVLRLHGRGIPVVAADAASTPPVALARRDVPYVRFDFERYELDGLRARPPYTIVLRHVLEHVRDPHAFLSSLIRQGARQFYVVVPNAASRERRLLGRHWYLWDPPRHLWHFDRPSLERLCARAGLDTVRGGTDTAPTALASVYRFLCLRGAPGWLYRRFGPSSALTALTAPANLLVAGNVLWLVARTPP